MILGFLSVKNGVLASYDSFFVEKVQKNLIEKIPQIHFHCIFSQKFSKIFKSRTPLAEKNLGEDSQKSPNSSLAQFLKKDDFEA